MKSLYGGADELPLDEQFRSSIRSDRLETVDAARKARALARRSGERRVGAVDDAVDAAQARSLRANKRLDDLRNRDNPDPELLEAAKLEAGVARRKLNSARAAAVDVDRRAPTREALQAGRKVRQKLVPSAIKDLESKINQSLSVHGIAKADPLYKEVRHLGRSVLRGQTTGSLRKARSDLRTLKANYRYGRGGKQSNFAAADVLDEVEKWFDDQLTAAYSKRPEIAGNVKLADTIYAGTKPIEEASVAALKRGGKETTGSELLSALSETMTPGQFARGGGGTTREVAEALSEVRRPLQTGIIERSPMARVLLGTLAVPSAAVMAAKGPRRLLQGSLGYQRGLKRKTDSEQAKLLARTLKGLRPGVPGATVDRTYEELE
jgi:hypothetical protein